MDFPAAIIAAYSVTLDVGWLVRRDDIIVMLKDLTSRGKSLES